MTPDKKTTVALTGCSGYIAGRVIGSLLADERVDRILGFDVREPSGIQDPRFVFDPLDVRDPALAARLSGVDVVVHLAFIMDPIKDETKMRDVNVNGSQNVFRAAGKAGVPKVVYTSSATVYGAHPDNDVPLTEESPLRANLDFSYPAHKLEVEYVVREFRDDHPDTKVIVLRPAIVFGPHVDNAWSHMLELPATLSVRGFAPPMQFVHEDDVAAALVFAIFEDLDGPYNLAADGWLEFDELAEIVGKRKVELPESIAFEVADRLWATGLGEAPAGMLHYLMHPWVLATGKLAAAGFKAQHSNLEAFNQTLERTRGQLRLGRKRLSTKALKGSGLALAGLTAGALALKTLRRPPAS